MSRTMAVKCNFIGDFKVGDNVVYNTHVLCDLVRSNRKGRLNKPITLQVGSIIEACLSQVIYRAQNFHKEGVPNISESDRKEIVGKKVDKFNAVIDVLRKYEVLHALGGEIYADLHDLRRLRNKIHIQDDFKLEVTDRDESNVFSDDVRDWALNINNIVLKHLSVAFKRPARLERYVQDLRIPISPLVSPV